jgi:hypothetical protein
MQIYIVFSITLDDSQPLMAFKNENEAQKFHDQLEKTAKDDDDRWLAFEIVQCELME